MRKLRRRHAALLLVPMAALWVRRVLFPSRPDEAPRNLQPRPIAPGTLNPSRDGTAVRIVVNPSAGPAFTPSAAAELREGLPHADIVEVGEGDDLVALLSDPRFAVIGAAGGDGTLNAAAAVAAERDTLFVAVPAGTLNHFARELGLGSVADAVEAVQSGCAVAVDVGTVDDRIFLNTLSLGGYSKVVDTRDRLARWMGKWPALVVALMLELPRMQPLRVTLNGERTDVWLGWVGNGVYGPPGLAPAWRQNLNDGLLDVRIVHGGPRYARTRFVLAALMGRLSALSVYSELRLEELKIECLDGPQRIAADGETFDSPATFTVGKKQRALRVALAPATA